MIEIKGQYSIEFILVFAFSLIVIIPLINLMHSQYSESKDSLDESQARQVLDQIAMAAQTTYYSGYPTRTTLELFFPKGISDITHVSMQNNDIIKSELVFKSTRGSAKSDLVAVLPFNISVSLKTTDGKRRILVKAEQIGDRTLVNITDAE